MDVFKIDWKAAAVLAGTLVFVKYWPLHQFDPIDLTSEKTTVASTNTCSTRGADSNESTRRVVSGEYISPSPAVQNNSKPVRIEKTAQNYDYSKPVHIEKAAQDYDTINGLQGIPTKGNQQGSLPHWAAPGQVGNLNGIRVK